MKRSSLPATLWRMSGIGSAIHRAAQRPLRAAGIKAAHVPFESDPETLADVVVGRVDFLSTGTSWGLPVNRSGRLIPLAVGTRTRSSVFPGAPATLEVGLADSDCTLWNSLLPPVKAPRGLIDWLRSETTTVPEQPSVMERLVHVGVAPMPLTPKAFDMLIVVAIGASRAIVEAAELKCN